jgi:hypothetical protein
MPEYKPHLEAFSGRSQSSERRSTDAGRQMSHLQLESPPTWDGVAAAHGRLYLSAADGTLVCLAEQ